MTTRPSAEDGSAPNDGLPLHSIGEAARLAGVSRATVRLWERERLINPARTPGGH